VVLKVFPEGTSVVPEDITTENDDNAKLVRAMEQIVIKRQIDNAKEQQRL
jgi:hypothetical protein